MEKIETLRPDWQELLDKRSIDWMLVKRGEALAQIALFSGKWRSVYEDSFSQVLIRQTPAPQSSVPQEKLIQQTVSHNQPANGQWNSGEFQLNLLSFAEIQKGEFMTLKKKMFRSLRHPVLATVMVATLGLGVVSTVPSIRNQIVSNLDSGSNFFWFDDAPESGNQSGPKKGNTFKRVFGAPFRLMARMFKRDDSNIAKKMSEKDLEKMKVVPVNRSQNGTPGQIADADGTAAEATTAELAAQNMFEEAVELHGKGRVDGAMEKLIAATVVQPNFSEAYNLLGVCYDEKGQYESAQSEYKKALKIEPNNARFLNNLGYSFYLANDFGDSVKYYKRGLKITPNDRRMHNNIGLAYGRKGDYDKAKEHFTVAVGEVGALLNLGFIYSQDGKHDDAIKSYQAALKIKPDSLQAMSNLAQLYERKGWLREAGALQAQYKKLSDEEKNKDQVVDREP
jgi:Flp pilus assembly protein TadD